MHPEADQFNSIHEKLLEFWPRVGPATEGPVHFVSQSDHLEDFMTVTYLADTAQQSGLEVAYHGDRTSRMELECGERLSMPKNDHSAAYSNSIHGNGSYAKSLSAHVLECRLLWLEPPWKVLLSNKAILAVLWELFPECPYLLPAHMAPTSDSYIRKPTQAREGANVQWVEQGNVVAETEGPYSDGPCVYQAIQSLPQFDGNYPVLGSWMVNGYACGLGIREDTSPITQNTSRFVPHLFQK